LKVLSTNKPGSGTLQPPNSRHASPLNAIEHSAWSDQP
jgi:hypothetical protein